MFKWSSLYRMAVDTKVNIRVDYVRDGGAGSLLEVEERGYCRQWPD